MDRFDRIFQLHRILSARRTPISERRLEKALDCSRATVGRTIATMRNFLNAPIEYDRDRNGYYYVRNVSDGPWSLPGLWFSAEELQALLTLQQLLESLSSGLLAEQLRPFQKRIQNLLERQDVGTGELHARLHILGMGVRQLDPLLFRTVASALGSRLRLAMHYCSRSRDEATERTVSPQRLVFYRDNWYLDAWCHLRDDARIFALDRIRGTEVTPEPAIDLDEDGLDTRLEDSYGIFHGEAQATALLRFSARMSRWVSEATWRPEQQGRWAGAGDYELEVPYSDPTELIRDILSYGPDVEVVHPAELREQVTAQLHATLEHYDRPGPVGAQATLECSPSGSGSTTSHEPLAAGPERLIQAIAFAADRHRGQRRKDVDATPYINHPIELARVLVEEGRIMEQDLLIAAVLHDTIEDTDTTPMEIESAFGERVCRIVREVSDDKTLAKDVRKAEQIRKAPGKSREAKLVKLADKICNLRDLLASPPEDWSTQRRLEYVDWASSVVAGLRGTNTALEATFDEVADAARKRLQGITERPSTG